MAAAAGRLLRASLARQVGALARGLSAFSAPRPVTSARSCWASLSWCGSAQAKLAFSTSSSYHVPAVTQHAPYFKGTAVVNGEFKDLSLDDFKGKYLVLFFYPLDFTFVCPTEIVAFSDKANEFHDVNCEVVAVSVDSHFSHLAWINTPRKNGGLGHMNIALLSDLTKQISRDYGVLLEGSGVALRSSQIQLLPRSTLRRSISSPSHVYLHLVTAEDNQNPPTPGTHSYHCEGGGL
ncbi:thioredoxin-dependent peroxide reductase, mitochondrial isoform X2 [Ochotona curzoniae]|uniref:thioredoxin-dependent peroxide reductase, mitochondrial isoform X2 n=1 Tax=Ochotona curzoniae TaxID=130825 RepID=UPI001B3461E7|nr:thioredoxin-dependent peroxide reductase, mitochondrial isoform X2 [Ochotona curzoniae]